MNGAELVAVCSRNEANARGFAKIHGARHWFTDYRRLVEHEDLDVVVVSVPTGLHAEVTIAACHAGKHALVEKPLDTTLERAEMMIGVCRANNTKLGVVFQMRFGVVAATLKEAIDSGRLGRVFLKRRSRQVEPDRRLLRLRRLAGRQGARGWRLSDDSVHPHHRSPALLDGTGAVGDETSRHPDPRHRGRGHRHRAGELHERAR